MESQLHPVTPKNDSLGETPYLRVVGNGVQKSSPRDVFMPNKSSKGKNGARNIQQMQDDIFRKMSAGKKIKLASSFFEFAKALNKLGEDYGTRRIIAKNSRNSG